jgi:GDP-4-dehydro-6-deoxy-D-mannose reductase
MRVLVTGASGFVGLHLCEHLNEAGDTVLGTRNTSSQHTFSFESTTLDITDQQAVAKLITTYRPQVVYHLAGMAFVPEAEEHFNRALLVNGGGTHHVVRACHLLDEGIKVVVISSAEVYGRVRGEMLPISESTPVVPANNYSLTKLVGEEAALRYARYGKVKVVIARPFNHIGPGQSEKFVASSFAKQLADIARGVIPPVLRVGNLEARRDFSDVRDIVRGYRLAAVHGEGIYNFCSGRSVSIRSILDSLISISGVSMTVEQDPLRMRAADIPELVGSYAKAERDLGWKPQYQLEDTLSEMFKSW